MMSCNFPACCIASCEPAQMKMEIQKKIWTSRYEKRALTVAFVHTCALKACADPGIFVKGFQKTAWTTVFFLFFSPQLILQFTGGVQWFYYRENYTFPRIQRGPTFSGWGGGVQMLISVIFQGGPDPYLPS